MKKEVKTAIIVSFISLAFSLISFSVGAADVSELTVQAIGSNCIISDCDTSAEGELILPETISGRKVTHIAEKAFEKCKKLTRVVLPDTVTEIGSEAFSACTNLKEVEMTDSVQSLGQSVFSECYKLESITLSNKIALLPDKTFYLCDQLKSVNIPQDAVTIGEGAFFGCSSIKKIVLSEKITCLSARSFSNCCALEVVYFPSCIEYILEDAFEKCTELDKVYYASAPDDFLKINVYDGNDILSQTDVICCHDHLTASDIINVPATCTQKGYSEYNCPCGLCFTGKYTDAKGHKLNEKAIIKEATCTGNGSIRAECEYCSYSEILTISATGHSFITDKAKKPTCTTTGKTQGSHCKTCGYIDAEQKLIPATGHDFSLKIMDKKHLASKATYKKAAKYYYSCSVCREKSEDKTFTGSKLTLDAVKKTGFTSTVNSVTLKWSKVDSARGYAVYRKASDGRMKLLKRVRTNKIKIENLTCGKAYTFAVRAYVLENDSIVYSPEYATVKTATKPLLLSAVKAVQNNKAITLSWKKSKGATGYRIYKYDTKSDNWTVIKSNTEKCRLTVENLQSGRKYKFAVRAFISVGEKLVFSEKYRSIVTCTRPESPVLKSTSYKYSVRLQWKSIDFADGYLVKISDNPNSGYKTLASTSKFSYKADGLTSRKTYYFKVYSYRIVNGERIYSYASEIKKVKTK